MRRSATAVVVAAVALLGVLAAVDALRDDDREARAPGAGTPTRQRPPTIAETLREELVIGRVLYSDEDCRLHSLALPAMTDTLVFDDADQQVFRCRFESSEGWILEQGERLSPNWRFTARCSDGEIVVRDSQTGVVSRRIDGCTPAWRPRIGNRLTWVRDGAVYERGRPLLSADDLRAAARRHPNLAFTDEDLRMKVHVRALAWMDVDHLAASLGIRAERSAPEFLLVVFEGRKVVVAATNFRTTPSRFVATRTGSLLAGDDGTIVTAEGDVVDPPDEISEPRDVSFSPDERWLTWATGHSVYLVGTPRNNEPGKIIHLPIPAQDLGWGRVSQATQVGPPIRRGRKRR